MPFRSLAPAVAALLLAGAVLVGARGASPIPPVGMLLDPVRGAWASAAYAALPESAIAVIPALAATTEVRYDVRGVPHIFAASEADVVRALGWVVARDRLFQMELLARAGAGTLTELVGPVALGADSVPRRLGMARAAERALEAMAADGEGRRYLDAFADGVNAYLDAASAAEWPVEYKLLGRRPRRWLPVHTLHLYARMGWTLAYIDGERDRLAAEAAVGPDAARALFPPHSPIQEPIQPNGRVAPRFDFQPLPPPGPGDSAALALLPLLPGGRPRVDGEVSPIFASNNWAVAPARSRSGKALLAGDPHLELTLPSIWYEVHLVVPGRLDVYGVTIPGSLGVAIGFNRDLAWSLTNTGADVMDFYRETVDEATSPRRYRLDGAWRGLELREERYRGPRGELLRVDTIRFTHRGPLMRWGGDWVSLRWTVNEPSDLAMAFWNATRTATTGEFLDAFARDYQAPAQNVIVADRTGSIAIRSTGRYPIRPDRGDGLTIRDGSSSANDWTGFWPVDRYPQASNPAQGFLASANQEPIDPAEGAGYLGFDSAFEPWRALRINQLLRENGEVTVDDMRRWQTDPGSVRADVLVPHFLAAGSSGDDSPSVAAAMAQLRRWDRRYTRDNTGAALFERALGELWRRALDELIPPGGGDLVAVPTTAVLAQLLADSTSVWWDDRRTPEVVETRDVILRAALGAAFDSLRARHGEPAGDAWAWGKVAPRRIEHLLRLPGFAVGGLAVQGGRGTLNPSTGGGAYGASWRMVVELGDRVTAMGTYPGGQSGNPASDRYADRVAHWAAGELERLVAPAALDSLAPSQVRAVLTLTPGAPRR